MLFLKLKMFQPFLIGLEGILPFEIASIRSILDVEKTIEYFEEKGFYFLLDWTPENSDECYVPERFLAPSGTILDGREILKLLDAEQDLEKRREVVELYYYWLAVRHPDTDINRVFSGRYSFVDDSDMTKAFSKYKSRTQ